MRATPFFIVSVLIVLSCVDNGVKPPPPQSGGEEEEERSVFWGMPPVVINEVYAANADYVDEFGDDPGWVEFYNPADTAVNLNGYYLTGNASRRMWTFGDAAVEPLGYLTVFFSGRNRPDLEPPRDTIDLLRSAIGAWNWSDDRNTPPGRSTAEHSFVENTSISGTMTTRDNAPALDWASAVVMLVLNGWAETDVVDISGADQILLRGRVDKDVRLEIRLPHTGVNDWQAWPAVIRGTGRVNDTYTIEFPRADAGFPDLKNIYGVRFANPPGDRGTINFSFNSIVARRRGGNVHASFELGMGGGKLFLMDAEGRIRDSAAYPAATRGLSYARGDGDSGRWALSKPPTPNAANSTELYDGQAPQPTPASIPASGYYEGALAFTLPQETDLGFVGCDTSGRVPAKDGALRSGVTLNLTKTTVMRCARFKDGAYPSEPVMRTYIIGERRPGLPVVSIAVDPVEMFDPTAGLYMPGPNASPADPHYGANYWRDDELPVQLDFFEGGAKHAWSYGAGLRIFGNWSRANAKKSVLITFREEYGQKNLRYALFPEHPNLTKFKHFILRNNGNNFPQDYIRDMLMTSLTDGLGIDYQKGRSVVVYYNGQYFGIHNLRERANGDYFDTNYGVDEEFIDLVKVGGEVSRGSDADYQDIVRWLESVTLNDNNLRILEQRIDVGDFTNNFQCRIYYNDRDWPGNNMKRWRVNSPQSRWRWLMYDTDHGFDSYGKYEQSSIGVGMLAFATAANGPDWPNPPHSTFMLRKLLSNESYKNAFINRFSLLLATQFSPARVGARIDALMAPIESEIPRDQARWGHNAGTMSSQLGVIRSFGNTRAAQMQREIEDFFKLSGAVDFTVSVNGNGKVFIHDMQAPVGNVTFKAYPSIPVVLKAVPNIGSVFNGWSDGVGETERAVTVGGGAATFTAKFGQASF